MNKTTISLASVSILAIGFATAYAVYDYTTDSRRLIMETFDNAEKAYKYANTSKQKALLALESATQNEANAYDVYKSARCSFAFDKLAHNEPVSDESKDLCGIIKKDVNTKSTENLSLAK